MDGCAAPQNENLKFEPLSGKERIFSIKAKQYRTAFPTTIWFFNPWTGEERKPLHVEVDAYGYSLIPPSERFLLIRSI